MDDLDAANREIERLRGYLYLAYMEGFMDAEREYYTLKNDEECWEESETRILSMTDCELNEEELHYGQ